MSSVEGREGVGEGEGGCEVEEEEEDNEILDWGRGVTWTAASCVNINPKTFVSFVLFCKILSSKHN